MELVIHYWENVFVPGRCEPIGKKMAKLLVFIVSFCKEISYVSCDACLYLGALGGKMAYYFGNHSSFETKECALHVHQDCFPLLTNDNVVLCRCRFRGGHHFSNSLFTSYAERLTEPETTRIFFSKRSERGLFVFLRHSGKALILTTSCLHLSFRFRK